MGIAKIEPTAFSEYTGKTVERCSLIALIYRSEDLGRRGCRKKLHRSHQGCGGQFCSVECCGAYWQNANGCFSRWTESVAICLRSLDYRRTQSRDRSHRCELYLDMALWQRLRELHNNFGATGALPAYPALLGYLADWFVIPESSVKQISQFGGAGTEELVV